MASTNGNKNLVTPATTPGSFGEENRFLVPPFLIPRTRTPYHQKYPPPYLILTFSILQIAVFWTVDDASYKTLRFDPNKQTEVWRFFTYLFLHGSWHHLVLNVIIQCIFAWHLEKNQGSFRVGALYVSSGIVGALGAACVRPDLIVGASAGVYALLISHIAHIIKNFHSTKYKIYQCLCIAVLVFSDVAYNLGHYYSNSNPTISWGAHVVGALSGFFLGLVLYKSKEDNSKTSHKSLFWIGLILFTISVLSFLILNIQIRRCTSINLIRLKYQYFC